MPAYSSSVTRKVTILSRFKFFFMGCVLSIVTVNVVNGPLFTSACKLLMQLTYTSRDATTPSYAGVTCLVTSGAQHLCFMFVRSRDFFEMCGGLKLIIATNCWSNDPNNQQDKMS